MYVIETVTQILIQPNVQTQKALALLKLKEYSFKANA